MTSYGRLIDVETTSCVNRVCTYAHSLNGNLLSSFSEDLANVYKGKKMTHIYVKNLNVQEYFMVCCSFTVKFLNDVDLSNLKLFEQNSVIARETVTVLKYKLYHKLYLIQL